MTDKHTGPLDPPCTTEHEPDRDQPAASSRLVPGRLAALSAMAVLADMIPLPFVPRRALRQLRGTIAHDAVSRNGIALVSDARAILAEPASHGRVRRLLRRGAEVLARQLLRRLGPLAALSTAASTFEAYALGHLLDRYVRRFRSQKTSRMYEPEAQAVRKAIDAAVLRTFSPATEPRSLGAPGGSEDFRDEFTRWLDTLLLRGATLPSYLVRRLDAAFDDAAAPLVEELKNSH